MSRGPDDAPLERRMCSVCHLILTPFELNGKLTWSHGREVDHETVVGPPVDPEYRCDFCSAPDPTWTAECTPFLLEAETSSMKVAAQDDGWWACCAACASYIRRNDWPRLLYRATKSFDWPPGVPGDQMIAKLHDKFRQSYTGVVSPLITRPTDRPPRPETP